MNKQPAKHNTQRMAATVYHKHITNTLALQTHAYQADSTNSVALQNHFFPEDNGDCYKSNHVVRKDVGKICGDIPVRGKVARENSRYPLDQLMITYHAPSVRQTTKGQTSTQGYLHAHSNVFVLGIRMMEEEQQNMKPIAKTKGSHKSLDGPRKVGNKGEEEPVP